MTPTVRREVWLPHSREEVWQAITDSESLADWMYPNDFEPIVGHHFTFQVPANPKVNFDGLTVHCEVLVCERPVRLVFSWSVGGPVVNTRVTFRLEAEGDGTRVFLEHAGFDLVHPFGQQAFKGADYGWANMLGKLEAALGRSTPRE